MAKPIVLVAGKDPLEEVSGGHSAYVRAHALAARRLGFEPHLFCVNRTGGEIETDFGVLHRLRSPLRPYRQLMVAGHAPVLTAGIVRFLATAKAPHLVHGFGVWGYVGVAVNRAFARRGVTVLPVASAYTTYAAEARAKVRGLSSAHGLLPQLGMRAEYPWIRLAVEPYERRGYEGASLVLVNYESVRRLLAARYGIGATCRRVPYTSWTAFREPGANWSGEAPAAVAALQGAGPLVVTVARHGSNKGLDILLRALASVRASGVPARACLVGGGPFLSAHRRLAARLRLGDAVTIPGVVPDTYPYLQHADLFVLPSHEEHSGSLALIEALQAGLPVVASGVDGIPEDVVDGESALLVKPGDSATLARAITRVTTDAPLRQRLAQGARRVFTERFSAETFVEGLREAYAGLGVFP